MQLFLLFAKIILFTCLIIFFFVVALLVIYLLKRMWHKQRYKPVWTTISFVDRRSNLSHDEFIREYASVGKPVIITDIVKNWKASAKWTLDFFRSEYVSSKVSVKDCKSKTHVDMILANYIDSKYRTKIVMSAETHDILSLNQS